MYILNSRFFFPIKTSMRTLQNIKFIQYVNLLQNAMHRSKGAWGMLVYKNMSSGSTRSECLNIVGMDFSSCLERYFYWFSAGHTFHNNTKHMPRTLNHFSMKPSTSGSKPFCQIGLNLSKINLESNGLID